MSKKQEIDIETLLRRYAAGERDFSNLAVEPTFSGKVIDITDIEDPVSYFATLERDYCTNGVDLSDINLSKSGVAASFNGAILRRANLRDTVWQYSPTENIDFTGADMRGFVMESQGVFVRCNFTDVIYDETTSFWHNTFYGCDGDDFEGAKLIEVRFLSIGHWRR